MKLGWRIQSAAPPPKKECLDVWVTGNKSHYSDPQREVYAVRTLEIFHQEVKRLDYVFTKFYPRMVQSCPLGQ